MLDEKKLEAIIFDFDGVLTDNQVYVGQNGEEWVRCNRGDGLGFDILKNTHLKLFILSSETNPVVSQRGDKLKIPVYQGTKNKKSVLESLAREEKFELSQTLFVGNDINDFYAMKACGFSACPADSHRKILKIATFPLKCRGGKGVVREIIENILNIDLMKYIK